MQGYGCEGRLPVAVPGAGSDSFAQSILAVRIFCRADVFAGSAAWLHGLETGTDAECRGCRVPGFRVAPVSG